MVVVVTGAVVGPSTYDDDDDDVDDDTDGDDGDDDIDGDGVVVVTGAIVGPSTYDDDYHTSYLSFFLHNRNLRCGNFTLESA